MPIFAAISDSENSALGTRLAEQFPGHIFMIQSGQYLISAPDLTTAQVSERLGILGGSVGRVLLLNVANYTGWHSQDMWEWLAAQTKASADSRPPSADPT